jgi:hypothetical protein
VSGAASQQCLPNSAVSSYAQSSAAVLEAQTQAYCQPGYHPANIAQALIGGSKWLKACWVGFLAVKEDKPEVERPDSLSGAEAFASAVAAKLAGNDPGVARKTEEFLSDQSQLLRVQKKHAEDEHAARLHYLRDVLHLELIRRLA